MKKPLDTITSTDVFGVRRLDEGQVIELYDARGRTKGSMKVVSLESKTAFTVRNLYWYELLWRQILWRCRRISERLQKKWATVYREKR